MYAVGRPDLTREGRWMAAILFCGEPAWLSHSSAAALLGIEQERPGLIEISVPASRNPRGAPDLWIHRRARLDAGDFGTCSGIAVTAPILTLIDMATFFQRDVSRQPSTPQIGMT